MACVENIPPRNADSEMEEGEIVDDLDELSDISSEEEFLLRQRLQVLENYNNVLERKKAKSSFLGSGKRKQDVGIQDLSEISGTELEDNFPQVTSKASVIVYRNVKEQKYLKSHHKQKKKKDLDLHKDLGRTKEHKKKASRKKKLEVKVIPESSEESDDEYRNKRRKLANAVVVNRDKNDKTSLQDRLQKMLCAAKIREPLKAILTADKETETDVKPKLEDVSCSPIVSANIGVQNCKLQDPFVADQIIEHTQKIIGFVDLCVDDSVDIIMSENSAHVIDSIPNENNEEDTKKASEGDSDEDLEALRQHALKTKALKKPDLKIVSVEPESKPVMLSEDEDSDTAELRLICLKSALLKKAIERKQKQKLKKRLSQSSSLQDELFNEQNEFMSKIESDNNTDIESVDMDIGSDGDEKGKEFSNDCVKVNDVVHTSEAEDIKKDVPKPKASKEDELEEDEDLLRAKLLTSLSKNLPNLVDPNILNSIDKTAENTASASKSKVNVPEEKRIVINLGESDSEGEHEATKNLTKMHMKLSEQLDFQQKLDNFLKSTRMEVEKTELPDVVQKPTLLEPPQKFVPKAVNHLPKSEQIEYRNLVRRMTELGRLKEARNSSMSLINNLPVKETLKPRNVSNEFTKLKTINDLEEQIAKSRKVISEESAKIWNLKEEAKKLSQKYKIVATELRNIATAITLNKKEQRSVQNRLFKIRIQHQKLLNSSISKHSKTNGQLPINRLCNKIMSTKLQKENDPSKEEFKNPHILKSVKVSVVNDLNEETIGSNSRLSVQVDVANNKKTVKIPTKDNRVINVQRDPPKTDNTENNEFNSKENDASPPVEEKGGGHRRLSGETVTISNEKTDKREELDDYKSPLEALGNATWEADPNAILCPFEVDGSCKDPDCKYLHPQIPKKH